MLNLFVHVCHSRGFMSLVTFVWGDADPGTASASAVAHMLQRALRCGTPCKSSAGPGAA
jgi:hypothetical protein